MKMSGFARTISSISERNEFFLLSMMALVTFTPFGSTVVADRLEHRLGERRLRHDQVDALCPLREDESAELAALQVGVRLRAHEISLVRQQRDRVRRRDARASSPCFPSTAAAPRCRPPTPTRS